MPFYEIIYETGSKSVAEYESDDEAFRAIKEHHERAKKGEPGRGMSTPRHDLEPGAAQVMDYPAERVSKVLVYDVHPASLNEDQTMSADVAKKELEGVIKGATKNSVVNLMEVSGAIRDLSYPLVADVGTQDSMYKMEAARELEWDAK